MVMCISFLPIVHACAHLYQCHHTDSNDDSMKSYNFEHHQSGLSKITELFIFFTYFFNRCEKFLSFLSDARP